MVDHALERHRQIGVGVRAQEQEQRQLVEAAGEVGEQEERVLVHRRRVVEQQHHRAGPSEPAAHVVEPVQQRRARLHVHGIVRARIQQRRRQRCGPRQQAPAFVGLRAHHPRLEQLPGRAERQIALRAVSGGAEHRHAGARGVLARQREKPRTPAAGRATQDDDAAATADQGIHGTRQQIQRAPPAKQRDVRSLNQNRNRSERLPGPFQRRSVSGNPQTAGACRQAPGRGARHGPRPECLSVAWLTRLPPDEDTPDVLEQRRGTYLVLRGRE